MPPQYGRPNRRLLVSHHREGWRVWGLRRRPRLANVAVTYLAGCLLALVAPTVAAAQVSCGQVVTQSATLDADLVCSGSSGLVIGADGITIDLNGHTISGSLTIGGVGIDLADHDMVTVRNGTLDGFVREVQREDGVCSLRR
jgi:hypothetical protein